MNRYTEVIEQYNENSSHEIHTIEEPATDYNKLEFVKAINLNPTYIENENREHIKNINTDEHAGVSFNSCLKVVDSRSSNQVTIKERDHFASPIAVLYDYSQSQSTPSTHTLDLIDSQSSEQTEVNVCLTEGLQCNTANEKPGAKTSVEELHLDTSLLVKSIEQSPNSAFSVNDRNTFILDHQENCSMLEVIKSTSFNNDNTEDVNMTHCDQGKLSGCIGREVYSEDYQEVAISATITGSIIESIIDKCFQSKEERHSNFFLENFIASTDSETKQDNEIQSPIKEGHINESLKLGQKSRHAYFKIGDFSQINVSKDMDCTEIVNILNLSGQETDNLDNNREITTIYNQEQIISLADEDNTHTDVFNSSQQIISSNLNKSKFVNTFNSLQQAVSLEKECRSDDIKVHNCQEENEEHSCLPGVHFESETHTLCISVPTQENNMISKMTAEKSTQDLQLSCYGTDFDVCEEQSKESKEQKSDGCKEDCQNDSKRNSQMNHLWPLLDATEKCENTKSFMNKSRHIVNNLDVSLEVTVCHNENGEEKLRFDDISGNIFREQQTFCIPKYSFPYDHESETTPNLADNGELQDPARLNKSQNQQYLRQETTMDSHTFTQNVSKMNCESFNADAECITESNQLSDGSIYLADKATRNIKHGIGENSSLKKQKLDSSSQRSVSDHDTTLVGTLWSIGGFKSNNDHADDSVVPQIASDEKIHPSQIEDTSDWQEKRMKLQNIFCSANIHDQILSTDDMLYEHQISIQHKCLTNPSAPLPLENCETTLPKFHIAEVSMESCGGELSIQSLIEVPGFISTKDYIASQESTGSRQGFSIHLSQDEQLELSPQVIYQESSEMIEKLKDQAVPVDLDVGDHVYPSDLLEKAETEPVLFYEDQPVRAYKTQESSFKWKYTPSCNLDEVFPSECESNQHDTIAAVKSLVTCARPFRVGLSKKQRVDHLHRSPKK